MGNNNKETLYQFAKNSVRSHLQKGKKNALTRSDLRDITGFSDRANRNMIEDLRKEGLPIISTSSSKGYWLPETKDELSHYINEFRSRARECNMMAARAENYLNEHANELED